MCLYYEQCKKLKVTNQYHLHRCDVFAHISDLKGSYDLIYIDPPYAKQKNEQLLEKISNQGLLSEDGILIIESLKEDEFKEEIGNLRLYKTANYGITKISYYERVL